MGQIYIKLKADERSAESGKVTGNIFPKKIKIGMTGLLGAVLPKANPDFDDKIHQVAEWILEVDEEDGIAQREIGIDCNKQVIAIMPWKNNYGFWTDCNLQLDKVAESQEIIFADKIEFDRLWNEFESNHD